MKKVTLKPTKEKSLLRKHPWVFSGAIKKIDEGIKDGDIVEVLNNKERYLCTGHYTEGTITVRAFDNKILMKITGDIKLARHIIKE